MSENSYRRIIFVHIPKCGGVSLRKAVYQAAQRQQYHADDILVPGESHSLQFDQKYRDISEIEHFKVIGGHYFPQGIDAGDLSFTFLREPLSRFMSHYYFFCYKKSGNVFCSEKTLSEMNSDELRKLTPLGNVMTKWLCGSLGDKSKQPSVDQALDMLFETISTYGILSDMDSSIERMNQQFAGKLSLDIPEKLNQGSSGKKQELQEVMEHLSQINNMDLALYQAAKEQFDSWNSTSSKLENHAA